jgi:hypothetical protein
MGDAVKLQMLATSYARQPGLGGSSDALMAQS